MHFRPSIALLFIAISALSTGAIGQKIYKCGATYSDQACGDNPALTLRDQAPDAVEKNAMDQATQRDSRLANAMERDRLQQEQAARQHTAANSTSKKLPVTPVVKAVASKKAKKAASPSAEVGQTDDFVAHVPGSDQKKKPKKVASTETTVDQ